MIGEVEIGLDGVEKVALLAVAEFLVVGFVVHIDPGVGVYKLVVGIKVGAVNPEGFCFGMGIHIVRLASVTRVFSHNRHAPFGANYVFHEKGRFTHHWSPTRFIPTDGTVFKPNLQLSVIVIIGGNLVGHSGTNGTDPNGF